MFNQFNPRSFADWGGVTGSGGVGLLGQQSEALGNLHKALVAGSDLNPPAAAPGVGFPWRVEDLESLLRVTTFTEEKFAFWRRIMKKPIFNTVHEFNRLSSYGDRNIGIFGSETQLPVVTDSTYERARMQAKFAMRRREVSLVMSLVKPAHGNVLGAEGLSGTRDLLSGVNSELYYGDSAIDALQWDGLDAQLVAGGATIVDLRGRSLLQDDVVDGSVAVADLPAAGRATTLLSNLRVKSDLAKQMFPAGRYAIDGTGKVGQLGGKVESIVTESGEITLVPDVFIDYGFRAPPAAAFGDATLRPATPTISTAGTTPVNAASQFIAADAGNYYYSVVARNSFGGSAEVVVTDLNPGAVAAGDDARWGVTPGGANSPATLWYDVYRSRVGGTAKRLIKRIVNAAGAGATTIIDLNETLPFTTSAYLIQEDQETVYFGQLAPLLKIPLGTIDLTYRWALLLIGLLIYTAPRRAVIYRNVGRPTNSVA